MAQKTFIPLENNPEVMTKLAHNLGLSSDLAFHDVYSLTEPDLVAILPRPALALLFLAPMSGIHEAFSANEDANDVPYEGYGSGEPVIFFKQTINHACGLIGLLHSVTNGPAASSITPESDLAKLLKQAIPLKPNERAQLLHDSDMLEKAHATAAFSGDSIAPPLGEDPGHGFIAFVKGKDGQLWEMDGSRKGPVARGKLADDEDLLSQRALSIGPLPFLKREEASGSGIIRFSCTVLASAVET